MIPRLALSRSMFCRRVAGTAAGASRRFVRNPGRSFHASAPAFVKVGDSIPNIELVEGSPGNKVSIAKELEGKGVIIGVPAAFSPSCSAKHVPGYINSKALQSAGNVFVVSVNDPFVYVNRFVEGS